MHFICELNATTALLFTIWKAFTDNENNYEYTFLKETF
jgi:hypothetical protein